MKKIKNEILNWENLEQTHSQALGNKIKENVLKKQLEKQISDFQFDAEVKIRNEFENEASRLYDIFIDRLSYFAGTEIYNPMSAFRYDADKDEEAGKPLKKSIFDKVELRTGMLLTNDGSFFKEIIFGDLGRLIFSFNLNHQTRKQEFSIIVTKYKLFYFTNEYIDLQHSFSELVNNSKVLFNIKAITGLKQAGFVCEENVSFWFDGNALIGESFIENTTFSALDFLIKK
jgi:hypothetical protein